MVQPSLLGLPIELIFMIAEEIVERKDGTWPKISGDNVSDLISLSLACKELEASCAPVLFKRVISIASGKNLLQLLHALRRRPHLGAYVTDCHLEAGEYYNQVSDLEPVFAEDDVASSILDTYPCLSDRDNPYELPNVIIVLILQKLVSLRKLSTTAGVIDLVTYWPKERRLVGAHLSTLRVCYNIESPCFDTISSFHAISCFREDELKVAQLTLYTDWPNCHPEPRFSSKDEQLSCQGRSILASLQHMVLTGLTDWMIRTPYLALSLCSNLKHLDMSYIEDFDLSDTLKELSGFHLAEVLEVLNIEAKRPMSTANDVLSSLAKFIRLSSLAVPVLAGPSADVNSVGMWPPALQNLTLSAYAADVYLPSCLRAIANALRVNDTSNTMKTITIDWVIFWHGKPEPNDDGKWEDLRSLELDETLDLIDFATDLDEQCRSRQIALVHRGFGPEHKDGKVGSISTLEELYCDALIPLLEGFECLRHEPDAKRVEARLEAMQQRLSQSD